MFDIDKPFEPGDIVEWSQEWFRVIENNGDSGKVQEYPDGEIIGNFHWQYGGEKARRVGPT